MFQKTTKNNITFLHFSLFALIFTVSCMKSLVMPTNPVLPDTIHVVASVPENREPSAGIARVLVVGWYPQIEVDAQNRVHLAYVDADPGDVMYTVSAPGTLDFQAAEKVEEKGASGSFLALVLMKNELPIMSYYHQDKMELRLAYRHTDLKRMKEMGFKVDLRPWKNKAPSLQFPGMEEDKGPSVGMGSHWYGEAVAYGDQIGIASDLYVDHEGRAHLVYFRKGKVAEYAVRPAGETVFGVRSLGRFARGTLDTKAYASHSMTSDIWVDPKGTVWVSYGSWEMTQTRLRLASKKRDADTFTNTDISPLHRTAEGWHSLIFPSSDSKLEVFSLATDIDELLWGKVDRASPQPMVSRKVLVKRPGPFVAKRAPDGTLWILTRGEGMASIGDEPGLWLVKVSMTEESERWILEPGTAIDYWFDLEFFKDNTPIAVWFSHGIKGLKMYSPKHKVSIQPGMAVASPIKQMPAPAPTPVPLPPKAPKPAQPVNK
jgi:hypothetical protein